MSGKGEGTHNESSIAVDVAVGEHYFCVTALNEGPSRTTSGSQFFSGGMLDERGTNKLVYWLNLSSHLIVPHK